jgi:phosphoglycerol transferase MdoB-like AlkP superfamily enzyme
MSSGNRLNVLALICAIWFACTGAFWPYLANVFISFPVGLLGLYFWYKARRQSAFGALHTITMLVYVAGFCISVAALFLFK